MEASQLMDQLEPGRVYRTEDLKKWQANAPRLARTLEKRGALTRLKHGLFACPRRGRFGEVPPSDEALLSAFLRGAPFLETGPDRWNALGLGSTAVFASKLVYNTKRSGEFELGGRKFVLRRVKFPEQPSPEWFVVDLFENAGTMSVSRTDLARALASAVQRGAFDRDRLMDMAETYGTARTVALFKSALQSAPFPGPKQAFHAHPVS